MHGLAGTDNNSTAMGEPGKPYLVYTRKDNEEKKEANRSVCGKTEISFLLFCDVSFLYLYITISSGGSTSRGRSDG